MRYAIALSLLLLQILLQGAAQAALTAVSVNPARVGVAFNRPAAITVTWTITASPLNAAPVTASSSQVIVGDPPLDTVFGTIPRVVSRTIAPGATATITETVVLPRSVILAMQRARDLGGQPFTSFILRRDFTDDNVGFLAADATLYLTGGSGSFFQIDRMSLYFDDRSTVRLVPKDAALAAQLEIEFSGSGQLRGQWELATPASTLGEPVFAALRMVRQPLVGNQVMRLDSPVLPTGQEGVYLLRFSVTEPDTGFEPVYIRYIVTQTGTADRVPVNVQALAPTTGALLTSDTAFTWRADARAGAWQLEIFSKPQESAIDNLPDLGTSAPATIAAPQVEGPPVTGMLLTGDTRTTVLTALVREHLRPGQGYWWRVRALGDDGSVIGESPLLEFRTPGPE